MTPTELKDHALELLVNAFRLLIILSVLTLFWLVMQSVVVNAVECRSSPGDLKRSHWMWRSIDGEKCWYPGRRTLPKSRLEWPDEKPKKKIRMDPKLPVHGEARPNVFNAIDAMADENKPIFMLPPVLEEKLNTITRWWQDRWKP